MAIYLENCSCHIWMRLSWTPWRSFRARGRFSVLGKTLCSPGWNREPIKQSLWEKKWNLPWKLFLPHLRGPFVGSLAVFSGPRAIFRTGKHVVLAGVKQRTHQAELVGKNGNPSCFLQQLGVSARKPVFWIFRALASQPWKLFLPHFSQEVILGQIGFAWINSFSKKMPFTLKTVPATFFKWRFTLKTVSTTFFSGGHSR